MQTSWEMGADGSSGRLCLERMYVSVLQKGLTSWAELALLCV